MTDRWHNVAVAKLTAVVGAQVAAEHMAAGMRTLGLQAITSPDELYRLAQHLSRQGGFVGAVGGLLCVHATIHGARG